MTKTAFSSEIFSAASLHLGVLDDFIAVVESKLAQTVNPFARDSLGDLLVSLMEQRETYLSEAARIKPAHANAARPTAIAA